MNTPITKQLLRLRHTAGSVKYYLKNRKYRTAKYLTAQHIRYQFPKEPGVTQERYFGDGTPLIVSLTSFPARIRYVHKTIHSLLNQQLKPNRVILWLAECQFPGREASLPRSLRRLIPYGLEIGWTEDLLAYKKLIPALKQYPNAVIITADDDLYYPEDWTKALVESYRKQPNAIHCHLITKTECTEEGLRFRNVYGQIGDGSASYRYKILGGSGTLYPPGALHPDVTDYAKAQRLAPTNDDVWFWAMAAAQGHKIVWIEGGMRKLFSVGGAAEFTPNLFTDNNHRQKRTQQTLAVFREYGLMPLLTEAE